MRPEMWFCFGLKKILFTLVFIVGKMKCNLSFDQILLAFF